MTSDMTEGKVEVEIAQTMKDLIDGEKTAAELERMLDRFEEKIAQMEATLSQDGLKELQDLEKEIDAETRNIPQ